MQSRGSIYLLNWIEILMLACHIMYYIYKELCKSDCRYSKKKSSTVDLLLYFFVFNLNIDRVFFLHSKKIIFTCLSLYSTQDIEYVKVNKVMVFK